MKKLMIILFGIFIFSIIKVGFSQTGAEVSYVTHRGKAFLKSDHKRNLVAGQKIGIGDTVILEDGAQIRLLFLESQKSKRYSAPDSIAISEELETLRQTRKSADIFVRMKSELGKLYRHYINPKYSNYAGTRGIGIVKTNKIHEKLLSFTLNPTFVVLANKKSQSISIFKNNEGKTGEKIAKLNIPQGDGIIVRRLMGDKLQYGEKYFWNISGENQMGTLTIVPKRDAQKMESKINSLREEAIDKVEAAQAIGAYLQDNGFWNDAYSVIMSGLELDPQNRILKNIRRNILIAVPDDYAFQTAVKSSGEISLRYSFHLKKENHLREIYDGDVVHSGDLMRIHIKADDDCYLFILNIDSGNKLYVLYPNADQDYQVKKGKEIMIPENEKYFKADRQIGTEKLVFIASKIPLDYLAFELDKLSSSFNSRQDADVITANLYKRGFSVITDENGVAEHEITSGFSDFKLSRLLKGKGLFVKEITFRHVR